MTRYEKWLRKRITQVYEQTSLRQTRELSEAKLILFSDLHKGQRDGADDFEQCETVYLAALLHYWQQGFELFLLGDIEELWECRPKYVTASYENVLEAELLFAQSKNPARYLRLVGNHDDLWYDDNEVKKHLGKYLAGAAVQEGVRLAIQDQGQDLGELFLIHGHQGTLDSDRYRKFSKPIVRSIWRPIQRRLKFKSTTPSTNFELKKFHERAMYGWAASGHGRVLVAGHTHHPVWEGLSYQQAMERKIEAEGLDFDTDRTWIEKQIPGRITLPGKKPYYFNTGCCSFGDGSITGLEIESGQIRLVRWEHPRNPRRIEPFSADLRTVLGAVAAS